MLVDIRISFARGEREKHLCGISSRKVSFHSLALRYVFSRYMAVQYMRDLMVSHVVLENKIEFAAATLGMYYWLNRYFCEKSEI